MFIEQLEKAYPNVFSQYRDYVDTISDTFNSIPHFERLRLMEDFLKTEGFRFKLDYLPDKDVVQFVIFYQGSIFNAEEGAMCIYENVLEQAYTTCFKQLEGEE